MMLHHRFVSAADALGWLMPQAAVAYRRIASRLLSERGLAAVWQLHLDALSAHLNGYAGAARYSHAGDCRRCRGEPVLAHAGIRGTLARPVAIPTLHPAHYAAAGRSLRAR